MDSINKQQPEKNHENLFKEDAIKKIKALSEKSKTCFFSTFVKSDKKVRTRPMSFQKIDDDGTFWFLSASDSHKNKEIDENNEVQLLFQGSSYSDFLSLFGVAKISKDRGKIEELWEPILKAWFTEGIDDPRITVIEVKITEGYYWDNKNGNAIALIKTAIGAAVGKTLDDSIEGKLNP